MAEICSVCSKTGAKKCSRCKMQFYCSKECQTQDWKVHKKICREVAKKAADEKAIGPIRGVEGSNQRKNKTAEILSRLSGIGLCSVPEYHREYRRLHPADQANFEKLRDNWMMSKMLDETVFGDVMIDQSREYDARDLIKRWHYMGPELPKFLASNPKLGDIFTNRVMTPMGVADGGPLIKTIYQTIRNTPVPPVEFHFGQTYVSIGFVDMFQLLVGSYVDTEDKTSPLIFVGYDKSEVVIARSLIIYEMMLQGVCPESILQVWFSTGWSEQTLKDFHQTTNNLLKEKGSQIDKNVKMLISYWMRTKLTAAAVLPLWRQLITERYLDPLNNLRFEKDRMDYASYIFTGHIFGKKDKDYIHGNVTMFSLPEELDSYQRQNESFFGAIALSSLTYNTSLLGSITTKVRQGLTDLTEYIINNRLVCNFLLRDIDLKDKATLREIKQFDAKMIDWSNLADYLSVEDFFQMAKLCSGSDTKHFLHFMNWVTRVFGASLIDYPNKSQVYKVLKEEMKEKYNQVKQQRPYMMDQYLVYFLNVADEILAERFRQRFIEYFTDGRDVVVGNVTTDAFNPFQRSGGCFYMSFNFPKKS